MLTGLGDLGDLRVRADPGDSYRDPYGEFTLEARAATYIVTVKSGRYVEATVDVTVKAGEDSEITVELELGGAIAGRVVDDRGEPVVGATVSRKKEKAGESSTFSRVLGRRRRRGDVSR